MTVHDIIWRAKSSLAASDISTIHWVTWLCTSYQPPVGELSSQFCHKMEFDRLSLEAWQRDQPLSILQLDPADRAVLRIAGWSINCKSISYLNIWYKSLNIKYSHATFLSLFKIRIQMRPNKNKLMETIREWSSIERFAQIESSRSKIQVKYI